MSRKKTRPRKPVPAILKTPIIYKFDLLDSPTPNGEAELLQVFAEITTKIQAVARYYDVQLNSTVDLPKLVLAMATELFPGGFRAKLEGAPVTRKAAWTVKRKIELLSIMRGHLADGMTLNDAAKEYQKIHKSIYNQTLDPTGIITRFKEAEAWERSGDLTGQEILDLLNYVHHGR